MRKTTCALLIGLAMLWVSCDGGGGGGGRDEYAAVDSEPEVTHLRSLGPEVAEESTPGVKRKLIRTAMAKIQVADLDATRKHVDELVKKSGGFISHSRIERNPRRVCTLVIRIPESKLETTRDAFKSLGKVIDESLETLDATTEFVDTEARIRNLTRTEKRLLDVLEKVAGNLAEILPVEAELNRVRGEIERLTARVKQIEDSAALSTIRLELHEESLDVIEEPDDVWKPLRALRRNAGALLKRSFSVLVVFFAGLANIVIVLIPWALLVGLVLVVRPKWRRALGSMFRRRVDGAEAAGKDDPSEADDPSSSGA